MLKVDSFAPRETCPYLWATATNQQIKLTSIETVDELTTRAVEDERCANAFSVDPTTKTVKLRAIIDPETLDTYSVLDGENCSMMHEEDSYFVSWFTTAELKRIFSDDVDAENELTLDKTAARTQIYVVARDGRGTLDFHCVEFFQMGANHASNCPTLMRVQNTCTGVVGVYAHFYSSRRGCQST